MPYCLGENMTQKDFLHHLDDIAGKIRSLEVGRLILFHHNDADGLTSGSILYRLFERLGWDIRRYCLEKPYPALLEFLQVNLVEPDDVIVIADFGSGIARELSALFSGIRMGLICDHHGLSSTHTLTEPWHLVNPLPYGVPGDRECSASAVCYLLSRAVSAENVDCAVTAVIGAVGDRHLEAGRLQGLNEEIFVEARSCGDVFLEDTYRLTNAPGFTLEEIADGLDILGSIAYLRGGPDIGIKALAEGPGQDERHFVRQYEKEYQEAYASLRARAPLMNAGASVQYFYLPEAFSSMGVKTVGLVCERMIQDGLSDPSKYLLGFQQIPDQIPGVGPFRFDRYKVSFRAAPPLRERIQSGDAEPLTRVLEYLGAQHACFVDACHPHAAALTIATNEAEQLIESCVTYLQEVAAVSSQ